MLKKNLSKLENEIYLLLVEEYNYLEIAKKLNRKPKTIDNTIQRIKRKFYSYYKKQNRLFKD